jgi:hypothetical protein
MTKKQLLELDEIQEVLKTTLFERVNSLSVSVKQASARKPKDRKLAHNVKKIERLQKSIFKAIIATDGFYAS